MKWKQFLTGRGIAGRIFDEIRGDVREEVALWQSSARCDAPDMTTFGFVLDGGAELVLPHSRHRLTRCCFFSVTGAFTEENGYGMLVHIAGYRGLNVVGGPVERSGRLKYIDGCTDTLLIAPVKRGDPCLNVLYFPRGIAQTAHTHPSVRLGAVLWGRGRCKTAEGTFPLEMGVTFCIPADVLHSFHTESDEMVVMAYHPDSDFGPEDENHPMINRTIVDGMSAAGLAAIRTK